MGETPGHCPTVRCFVIYFVGERMTIAIFALAATEFLAFVAVRHATPLLVGAASGSDGAVVYGFLAAFAIGTIILIGLLRFIKSRVPFEIIFGIALVGGLAAFFEAFFAPGLAFAFAAVLTIARFAAPRVFVQNAVFLLGLSGVAFAVGVVVRPTAFALLLAALAVYDIIAVYATRHMVTLFHGLVSRGVVAALVIPHRAALWLAPTATLKPGVHALVVGGGDLALPAAFVISALSTGIGSAIGAAAGSLVGMTAMGYLFAHQRQHRPMPALPPIVTGMLLGYLAGRVISSGGL